ncbi:MAG: GyrI-like domain-containing protein [Methylococcaceae bacterium]
MDVRIIDFPETKIAVLEHHGQPALEYQSIQKLIEWRIQNRLFPEKHRSYGLHYNDLRKIQPEEYHVLIYVYP